MYECTAWFSSSLMVFLMSSSSVSIRLIKMQWVSIQLKVKVLARLIKQIEKMSKHLKYHWCDPNKTYGLS